MDLYEHDGSGWQQVLRFKNSLRNLWTVLEFVLKNFATPIAFFVVFEGYGAKPAIAMAIGVTFIQLFAHWILELSLSPFFLVASGFTVALGSIDLVIASPQFYRLEPFAQNFVMSVMFASTLFTKMPMVAWFAAALPEKIRPNVSVTDPAGRRYFRQVTFVWSIYFVLKSFFFLYLAFQVDLGRLVILRSVIGGVTLAMMLGGELAYRKWVKRFTS